LAQLIAIDAVRESQSIVVWGLPEWRVGYEALRSTGILMEDRGDKVELYKALLKSLSEIEPWSDDLADPKAGRPRNVGVPRRLFIGPLGDSYASMWFREALGEGYAWWRDWEGKVPHWEIFVYEVLNYTDGKRSLAEIEDAVEAEFGDVPDGTVEHILRDLEKVKLVEFAPPKSE